MIQWLIYALLVHGFAAGMAVAADGDARMLSRYRELLEARPEPGVVLERLWAAADQTKLLGEYRQRADAGDATAALILGHLLAHAGRNHEALEAFLKAASLDDSRSIAWESAALLARDAGDPESAAAWLDRAESTLPADDAAGRVRIATLRARMLASLGKKSEAAEILVRVIRSDHSNDTLRQSLVEQYLDAGMREEAGRHLEILAASARPEIRVGALRQLASLEAERGNAAEAVAALERALDLTAPDHWMRSGIVRDLARIAGDTGAGAGIAEKWEKQAIEEPSNAERTLRLVELSRARGDASAELLWMDRFLEKHPALPGMEVRRAELLGTLGRHAEAAELLRAQWQAAPDDPAMAFAAAESLMQSAQQDAALQLLEEWAELVEDSHPQTVAFLRKHHLHGHLEEMLRGRTQAEPDNRQAWLELVEFHAERGEMAEAVAALEAGAAQDELLAAGGVRIFLNRNALREAEIFLEKAGGEQVWLELRGDWQKRMGNYEEAVRLLEEAMSMSTDPESVDQRIWNVVRAWEDAVADGSDNARQPWEPEKLDIRAIMEGTEAREKEVLMPMAAYLQRMTADADSPEDWVRVAAWSLRSGDAVKAIEAANRALADGTPPEELRSIFAQTAVAQGDRQVAIDQLTRLIREDPEGADGYRNQLAGLVAVQEGPDAALEVLKGGSGPASEIARAEVLQDSQRWYDAVDAWRAVLPRVPQEDRQRVIERLVPGLEQTGRAREAVDLLWKEVVSKPPGRERTAANAALEALAARHSKQPEVARLFQEAAGQAPQDFTLLLETAAALRKAGESTPAQEMLPSLYRLAGDDRERLRVLAMEAEAIGDAPMAVRLHRQLIAQNPEADAGDYEKLAARQLDLPDFKAAVQTFRELVIRYPRDADALVRAAAFYEEAGMIDEALPLRKQAAELAPENAVNLRELGEWLLIRGENAEAVALWESVLARPSQRDPAELILPPAPGFVLQQMRGIGHIATRSRGGSNLFSTPPPSAMAAGGVLFPDLEAVAHLALLRQRMAGGNGPQELTEDADLSMELWDLYYSGEGEEFGRRVFERMRDRHPGDGELQKAIWLTLEAGGAGAAGGWMARQTEPDAAEVVLHALRILARLQPEMLTADFLARLFPPEMENAETLWQAAQVCAGAARYEAAMHAGMRVLDLSRANQSTYACELAMWALWRGDRREAMRLFLLATEGPVEGFASVPAAAWRAAFLLLPGEDRAAFIENAPSMPGTRMDGPQGGLVLALLHGLEGRNEAAMEHLGRRQSAAVPSASPDAWGNAADEQAILYWNQVFAGAARLEEWGMTSLARKWLELALADQARIRLHGDAAAAVIAECRLRATSLKVLEYALAETDWAQSAPELPDMEFSRRLVDQLESFGMLRFAFPEVERALKENPAEPEIILAYLRAARAAGWFLEPWNRVEKILEDGNFPLTGQVPILQALAAFGMESGQVQRVVDILEMAPEALPLQMRMQEAHAALGKDAEADALLAQIVRSADAPVALRVKAVAAMVENDPESALEIAREIGAVEDAAHAAGLARIFLQADATADVQNFLRAVSAKGNAAVVSAVLEVMTEHAPDFDREGAWRIAMSRSTDRGRRVELFQAYLLDRDEAMSLRDLENLHSLTLRAGRPEAEVYEFFLEHVRDDALLDACMRHAVAQAAAGQGGLEFALAEWHARNLDFEKVDLIVTEFLGRPAHSRHGLSLMLSVLQSHERLDAAVAVADRLLREFPDDVAGHVRRIGLLQAGGRSEEADGHLALLRYWLIANPAVPREFAKEFENQGLIEEAGMMLEDAAGMASAVSAFPIAKERVEFLIRTRQREKLLVEFPRFLRHFGPGAGLELMRNFREVTGDEGGEVLLPLLTPDVRKALGADGD